MLGIRVAPRKRRLQRPSIPLGFLQCCYRAVSTEPPARTKTYIHSLELVSLETGERGGSLLHDLDLTNRAHHDLHVLLEQPFSPENSNGIDLRCSHQHNTLQSETRNIYYGLKSGDGRGPRGSPSRSLFPVYVTDLPPSTNIAQEKNLPLLGLPHLNDLDNSRHVRPTALVLVTLLEENLHFYA